MKTKEEQFLYEHDKKNGIISVVTPFNKEFVTKARNLGGKWNKEFRAWEFKDNIEDYIKTALNDCYGVTGEHPIEYCSLLIKDYDYWEYNEPVTLFGRTIAVAWGRDSGAKLGEKIVWISGKYKSGGSVKNWKTEVEDGFFEIQDFPLPRTQFKDVQKAIEEGWCEIKTYAKKRTKEQLQAEIDRYTAILEELKNEINNL